MNLSELENEILKLCRIEGDFTLRSGKKTNHYFDKYLFESNPSILSEIAWQLNYGLAKQQINNFDVYAGLEMGGIPIATVLSHHFGKPAVFVRKRAKGYGTQKLAEGMSCTNKKLCVVEDVVTTGGQVIDSCNRLIEQGAKISVVACVILRDSQGKENIEKAGYRLYNLFDFSNGN